MVKGNLLIHQAKDASTEIFETLLSEKFFYIERIITNGQRTAEGIWLRQKKAEFVALLKGNAILRFREDDSVIKMSANDYIIIPPNCEHRVDWVSEQEEAVWLAIHYDVTL